MNPAPKDQPMPRKGGCECGAIRYKVTGSLRDITYCHCTQCRRMTGHFWAATQCDAEDLHITKGESALIWYQSSASAERGFCKSCGSSLFWRKAGEGRISIGAGTLFEPTGLCAARHIFTADQGDYYQITDDLPKSGGN